MYEVRFAATGDRQGSDKIMRENRQLHVQLHEHLSKKWLLFFNDTMKNDCYFNRLVSREKQREVWICQQETIRRLEQIVREGDSELSKLRLKLTETESENRRQVEN